MPAPAVYVLAIVGTVGAVIAFKEFVYEPHIAPTIDRWVLEFQAARRRRQRQAAAVTAAAYSGDEDDVPMSQTTRNVRKPVSKAKFSDDTDTSSSSSSDDEASTSGVHENRLVKGGLLLRCSPEQRGYERLHDSISSPPVIELDDLVAREVREWRNGANEASFPGQTLRQRKNANTSVAEHAMDESNHAIPYTPLSPSRTHVLFDSSSSPISTPTSSGSRVSSPPLPPLPAGPSPPPTSPHPLSFSMTASDANNADVPPQSPAPQAYAHQALSPLSTTLPSPRFGSPFQQSIEQSPLFSTFPPPTNSNGSPQTTLTVPTPNTTATYPVISSGAPAGARSSSSINNSSPSPTSPAQPQPQPQISASSIYSQSIPSLSQSYPQELDYEHGLELLSPPSSRSMSPFSMAGLSPNLNPGSGSAFGNNGGNGSNGNGQGLRVLSSSPASAASSAFSSALSSPALGKGRSPLAMMDLGNDSFDDTVSPQLGQARQLGVDSPASVSASGAAPALAPPQGVSVSGTSSTRSTTYLSFDGDDNESSAGDSDVDVDVDVRPRLVPYPRVHLSRATTVRGPGPGPAFDTSARSRNSGSGSGSGSGSLLFMDDSMTTSIQTPTQESSLTPHTSINRVVPSPRSPSTTSVRGSSASPQAQAQAQAQTHPQLRSPEQDALSDIDFFSESSPSQSPSASTSEFEFEYAMSEPSDLGNESAGEGAGEGGVGRPGSQSGRSEAGESDGWSMPDHASPNMNVHMGGSPPNDSSASASAERSGGRNEDYMATITARSGRRFGWR